jgi:hypothetical protein
MNGYYHWDLHHPSVKNSYIMAGYANELRCSDYASYSSYDRIFDRTNSAQAALAWNYAASGNADDCTRAFCERMFPTAVEEAVKAYHLLDSCNEEGFVTYENGEKALDTRTLMERTCAYYVNSYLSAGKPYPRNFPGEGMQAIFAHREILEPKLHELSKLADETYKAFERLKADLSGDFKLARRYSAEARNYRDIVDDYIALIEIDEIVKSGDKDAKAKLEQVQNTLEELKSGKTHVGNIDGLDLLSAKPVFYMFNMDEAELTDEAK